MVDGGFSNEGEFGDNSTGKLERFGSVHSRDVGEQVGVVDVKSEAIYR